MKYAPLGLAVITLLGISACQDTSPIVSGRLDERELSLHEVAYLNGWLESHRSDWGMNMATPPVPSHTLIVRQRSGHVSSMELFSREGWKNAVIFDGRMAVLPNGEVANLRERLGAGG